VVGDRAALAGSRSGRASTGDSLSDDDIPF
jgi:hypothetical protein